MLKLQNQDLAKLDQQYQKMKDFRERMNKAKREKYNAKVFLKDISTKESAIRIKKLYSLEQPLIDKE